MNEEKDEHKVNVANLPLKKYGKKKKKAGKASSDVRNVGKVDESKEQAAFTPGGPDDPQFAVDPAFQNLNIGGAGALSYSSGKKSSVVKPAPRMPDIWMDCDYCRNPPRRVCVLEDFIVNPPSCSGCNSIINIGKMSLNAMTNWIFKETEAFEKCQVDLDELAEVIRMIRVPLEEDKKKVAGQRMYDWKKAKDGYRKKYEAAEKNHIQASADFKAAEDAIVKGMRKDFELRKIAEEKTRNKTIFEAKERSQRQAIRRKALARGCAYEVDEYGNRTYLYPHVRGGRMSPVRPYTQKSPNKSNIYGINNSGGTGNIGNNRGNGSIFGQGQGQPGGSTRTNEDFSVNEAFRTYINANGLDDHRGEIFKWRKGTKTGEIRLYGGPVQVIWGPISACISVRYYGFPCKFGNGWCDLDVKSQCDDFIINLRIDGGYKGNRVEATSIRSVQNAPIIFRYGCACGCGLRSSGGISGLGNAKN